MQTAASIRQVIFLFVFLLLSISSCKIASEKETAAITKIASFWAASVSYGVSVGTSTSKGSYHTFTLEIKDCPIVDNGNVDPEAVANSAAWILYRYWTEEERKKFTNVEVTITKGESQKSEFSIPIKTLSTVHEKLKYLNQTMDFLKQKDANAFMNHLDTTHISNFEPKKITTFLNKIDSVGGPIKADTLFTFMFSSGKDFGLDKDVLSLGTMVTSNRRMRFLIVVDTNVSLGGTYLKAMDYTFIENK